MGGTNVTAPNLVVLLVAAAAADGTESLIYRHMGIGTYPYLFHPAVPCDRLRCGAYGTFCYGIS